MENLRQAGERLSKYELEKKHAIEIEDYDRARHKKTLMDDYRKQVYEQVMIEQLLETNGVCSKNDECLDTPTDTNKQDTCSPPSNLKLGKNQKVKERSVSPNVTSQLYQTPVSPLHNARPKSPNIGKQRDNSLFKTFFNCP